MGVQITEFLAKKEIDLNKLQHKTLAVDAANHLYQFLSNIRSRDGSFLTDSSGHVTSHLIGLLSRTTRLLQENIKLIYVFDGKVPELKKAETSRRREIKIQAAKKYDEAEAKGDEAGMRKFAARTSRLNDEMIKDAKTLLDALGVPHVDAPSEGEAQAAHMAKKDICYAVASQDADCLLFQSPILIRNLSLSGKRKLPGKASFQAVSLELISLKETLRQLDINQSQLISLAMLVGTDYNMGGVKGVGPKNGLKLVKEHKTPDKIFSNVEWEFNVSWNEVYDLITNMPVTDDIEINFRPLDPEKLTKFLVDQRDFSQERIEKTVSDLAGSTENRKQTGLGDFS